MNAFTLLPALTATALTTKQHPYKLTKENITMKTKLIEKLVNDYNKKTGSEYPVEVEGFKYNVKRYIKAIKENRMMCSIDKVAPSGMSRTLKFVEMVKGGYKQHGTTQHNVYNFYVLFDMLQHEKVRDSDYFRIHGCGMDMVFNTNYNIIREFYHLGFITLKTCKVLEQKTPHVI